MGTSSPALSYTYGHTIHFHSEQDPPHPLQVPKQGTSHICVCVCVAACVNLLSTHAHFNPQCESPDIPTPDVTYLSRHTFSSFTDTFLLLTCIFHCLSYSDRLGSGTLGCRGCSDCTGTNISWRTKYSTSINDGKELCACTGGTNEEKNATATSEEQRAKAGDCARPLHAPPLTAWEGSASLLSQHSGPTPGLAPPLSPWKELAHPDSVSR